MIPTNGKIKFKEGDIVYFKTPNTAKYGCEGGSYDYHFTPGVPYRISHKIHITFVLIKHMS